MTQASHEPRLKIDNWQRLRTNIAAEASSRGCPRTHIDFVVSTALFASWIAETLDRTSGEEASRSAQGWASRSLDGLLWSLQHGPTISAVDGAAYPDADAWDLLMTTEDAIPVFAQVSQPYADLVQAMCTETRRVTDGDLAQARRVFRSKVVAALNALYGADN